MARALIPIAGSRRASSLLPPGQTFSPPAKTVRQATPHCHRVVGSRLPDTTNHPSPHSLPLTDFSPAGHGRRRFFIEHSYGGCPADTGWLVATSETWCSWETAESNKPNLVYSSADSMRNQNDADSRRADTFVIYARFGTPITSQRRSCEAGLASARLLSGADYFDPATQRVADASGNGRIATVDNTVDFVPASFAPNEEVASSKCKPPPRSLVHGHRQNWVLLTALLTRASVYTASLVWIETPTNLRYSSAFANKVYTSIEPPQVPAAATAIITSVYTFQGGDRYCKRAYTLHLLPAPHAASSHAHTPCCCCCCTLAQPPQQ